MNIVKKAYALSWDFRGIGRIGLDEEVDPGGILTDVVSNLIGIMTVFGLLWFTIQIIVAGYGFISAGGDNQKIKDAQQKIQNNFIGAIIMIAAVFLLSLVGELIGIPNILDLNSLIESVSP